MNSSEARRIAMAQKPKKETSIKETIFSKEEVDFTRTPLFFPESFEKLFLALYFFILPYITGVLFLFFYISKGKTALFLPLYENSSSILIWAIGYETLVGLMVLLGFKMLIGMILDSRN